MQLYQLLSEKTGFFKIQGRAGSGAWGKQRQTGTVPDTSGFKPVSSRFKSSETQRKGR